MTITICTKCKGELEKPRTYNFHNATCAKCKYKRTRKILAKQIIK